MITHGLWSLNFSHN